MIGRSAEANSSWDGLLICPTNRSVSECCRGAKADHEGSWARADPPRFEPLFNHAERRSSSAGGIGPNLLPRTTPPSRAIRRQRKDLICNRLCSSSWPDSPPPEWQKSRQKPATFCHFWGMVQARCSAGNMNWIDERAWVADTMLATGLRGGEHGADSRSNAWHSSPTSSRLSSTDKTSRI